MNMTLSNSDSLLLSFGLLEPKSAPAPVGAPTRAFSWGRFQVEQFGPTLVCTCSCGRYEPLLLHADDESRCSALRSTVACPICVREAMGKAGIGPKLVQHLHRNKTEISDACILWSKPISRIGDGSTGTVMRKGRYIYEKFYDVKLKPSQKVLSTCGNPHCINPNHLRIAASPASKITPEIKEAILECLRTSSMTHNGIAKRISLEFNMKISRSSVSNIVRDAKRSDATSSC